MGMGGLTFLFFWCEGFEVIDVSFMWNERRGRRRGSLRLMGIWSL